MFPRMITVECLCPEMGNPGDKYAAKAQMLYRACVRDGKIDMEIVDYQLWLNDDPVLDEIPGCYQSRLERMAIERVREIVQVDGM